MPRPLKSVDPGDKAIKYYGNNLCTYAFLCSSLYCTVTYYFSKIYNQLDSKSWNIYSPGQFLMQGCYYY